MHKRFGGGFLCLGALVAVSLLSSNARAQPAPTTPAETRALARAFGFTSLEEVAIPESPELMQRYVKDRKAAILLGKALFWDMAVGSDGQACASCHFHAGADSRTRNQINPGPDVAFGNSFETGEIDFPHFAPNADLLADSWPFRKLENVTERHSSVLRDTNDVFSSAGVFSADLRKILPGREIGAPVADPVFNVDLINTRRVEPRHTPTVINSVYNIAQFWDGRAHNSFNGVTPFGDTDPDASILVNDGGSLVAQRLSLPHSSLASQAVGPPLSTLEMSFNGRHFALIARKVLNQRALKAQYVHPKDSVLGKYSLATLDRYGRPTGAKGLSLIYAQLIQQAFQPHLYSSKTPIAFDSAGRRIVNPPATNKDPRFSQMEVNFSLFFGLAVQLYEATLISDKTPYDAFMKGDDRAMHPDAIEGLNVFLDLNRGACFVCHAGAEFTAATESTVALLGHTQVLPTGALVDNKLVFNPFNSTFEDTGFFNIGVRPIGEDPGRAGLTPFGDPLSFTRQSLAGLPFAPGLPNCAPNCPPNNNSSFVNGAMKTPTLRNVELTGPYFHNGGQATLGQVIDFYRRQSDFAHLAPDSMGLGMVFTAVREVDRTPIIRFLQSLTDDRVKYEAAPFDHPQLLVPNGHPGSPSALSCIDSRQPLQACDQFLDVPAVGAHGRRAQGLPPLGTFLHLDPLAP